MFRRVVRAARFDPKLYAEVKDDPAAIIQAAVIVFLTSFAQGFPLPKYNTNWSLSQVLPFSFASIITSWLLFSALAYLPGRYLLKREDSLIVYMRVIGFTQVPKMLLILLALGSDPLSFGANLWNTIINLWVLAGVVVAYLVVMRVSMLAAFPLAMVGFFLTFLFRDFYSPLFL